MDKTKEINNNLGRRKLAETDLEKFVEAPGRDQKIKQVREMIDRMGIEYLYLQFVSVTGKIMGKGIPAENKSFPTFGK